MKSMDNMMGKIFWGFSLLLVLGMMTGLWGMSTAFAEAPKDLRVAVLYFDYDGPDAELATLKKGFAQMLITDINQNEKIDVVERSRLQEVLDELDLNKSKLVDPKTAVKVGKLIGANRIVVGSYFEMMGSFRVDARVIETETAKILISEGETGKRDDFLGIESRLADKLTKGLLASSGGKAKKKKKPAKKYKKPKKLTMETAVTYAKALDAIDQKKPEEAKKLLKKTVEQAPDFALAQDDLAGLLM